MKKKRLFRSTMNLNLTIIVMVELAGLILLGWLLVTVLRHFDITLNIPDFVWLLFVALVFGGVLTMLLSKWIFHPITRLGRAMRQVAKGDFSVRLKDRHRFREIEEIYRNFNLMTQELGATEILQMDFVSNVSHEFKTPINAIEGYATLLHGASEGVTAEQREYVDKILLNTRRLSRLTSNILLLSKVDNQAILEKTRFRLDEQIRQSILQLETQWETKELELDLELENLEIVGAENLLLHVWDNVIGNAVKFSPTGGRIRITLEQRGDRAVFAACDEGPGISESARAHIFDKFYQQDSSHKEEGNGLGLALVKQIVDLSHGTVAVENIESGGCCFTVEIPME
ncbi:MAG: HAMP domain-containing histidine kinase [Oscillospiraceae bacterium]|nr:HAMP domain-containing histidine kinase [Oscillospiraceae bacterium]